MSKIGGRRNYGYGKTLAWAGKNALKDRYGRGHFATQAAHVARWKRFAEFAKSVGIKDARDVTREMIREYGVVLANKIQTKAMSVRYAQNLLSSVNVVLETMRSDRRHRVSPAMLVGQRVNVRTRAPVSLDRRVVSKQVTALEENAHDQVAAVAALARDLGLRFREASLLNTRQAHHHAVEERRVNITRGTKGGRGKGIDRWIPVTPQALASLEHAATLQQDRKNLIPVEMSFRAWRDHAYGVWGRTTQELGLSGFHDLRIAYACERYEALTGAPAPVVAGERLADRQMDRAAREVIAQELGHGRVEVVAAYVGSPR